MYSETLYVQLFTVMVLVLLQNKYLKKPSLRIKHLNNITLKIVASKTKRVATNRLLSSYTCSFIFIFFIWLFTFCVCY